MKDLFENQEVSDRMSELDRTIVIQGDRSIHLVDVICHMAQFFRRSQFRVTEYFWKRFQIVGPSIHWREKMVRKKFFKLKFLNIKCRILKQHELHFLDPRPSPSKYWVRILEIPYGWRSTNGVKEIVKFGKVCKIDYCTTEQLEGRWMRVQIKVVDRNVIPEYDIYKINWLNRKSEMVKIWFVVEEEEDGSALFQAVKRIPNMLWTIHEEALVNGNTPKNFSSQRKPKKRVIEIGNIERGIHIEESEVCDTNRRGRSHTGKGKAVVVDNSAERKLLKKALRESRYAGHNLGQSSGSVLVGEPACKDVAVDESLMPHRGKNKIQSSFVSASTVVPISLTQRHSVAKPKKKSTATFPAPNVVLTTINRPSLGCNHKRKSTATIPPPNKSTATIEPAISDAGNVLIHNTGELHLEQLEVDDEDDDVCPEESDDVNIDYDDDEHLIDSQEEINLSDLENVPIIKLFPLLRTRPESGSPARKKAKILSTSSLTVTNNYVDIDPVLELPPAENMAVGEQDIQVPDSSVIQPNPGNLPSRNYISHLDTSEEEKARLLGMLNEINDISNEIGDAANLFQDGIDNSGS